MSSRKELTLTLPLLCLLVVLPFWRIATGQGMVITNDLAVSDMANLQHPLRHFAGEELRQGRLPLWTPGVYMGFPLLAEGQAGVFYPINLLLFGLLPVPTALNISVLLPFAIAAVGTYLLARCLGASIIGALVAGLSYALSGFFVVHVKHMPMVDAACWIPVVLWLVERGVRRDGGALLGAGLVMGVQWLTGAPQIAYYSAGVATLYFAGRLWSLRGERLPWRMILLFVLAVTLSLGLGAVQLLPTFELVGFSERAGGVGYEFAAGFPYALENLETFLYPLANGTPGTGDYAVSSIFWEDYAYLGMVPLLLGLIGGLALIRRSGLVRLLVGLTVVTFLLALGSNTVFYRLAYYALPGMSFFRFPQRFFSFAVLFLVILAALTVTRFQTWLGGKRIGLEGSGLSLPNPPHTLGGIILVLVVVDLYTYHGPWNAIVDVDTWLEPPATAQVVQERAGSALYRVFSYNVYNTFRAAYRQAGGWRGNLQPYIIQREFLQPSLNLIYDVPTADGYVNLVPDCLVALWGSEKQQGLMDASLVLAGERLEARPWTIKLLSLYNVRFLITSQPAQDEALALISVSPPIACADDQCQGAGDDEAGLRAYLYENLQTMPRVFAVPGYAVVDDVPAALDLMRSSAFDPATTVVLLEPPAAPPSPTEEFSSTVEVLTYEATRVAVRAQLSGPGWLVLSDTYYPGWEATVDEHSTLIYQANGCVRAVRLEAGQHEVVFRFRPRSFYLGALVSGISGALLIVAGVVLRRSRGKAG